MLNKIAQHAHVVHTKTASNGILVINPKKFKNIIKPIMQHQLNEHRVVSIAHQIESRCKNIEPKAVNGLGGSPR